MRCKSRGPSPWIVRSLDLELRPEIQLPPPPQGLPAGRRCDDHETPKLRVPAELATLCFRGSSRICAQEKPAWKDAFGVRAFCQSRHIAGFFHPIEMWRLVHRADANQQQHNPTRRGHGRSFDQPRSHSSPLSPGAVMSSQLFPPIAGGSAESGPSIASTPNHCHGLRETVQLVEHTPLASLPLVVLDGGRSRWFLGFHESRADPVKIRCLMVFAVLSSPVDCFQHNSG